MFQDMRCFTVVAAICVVGLFSQSVSASVIANVSLTGVVTGRPLVPGESDFFAGVRGPTGRTLLPVDAETLVPFDFLPDAGNVGTIKFTTEFLGTERISKNHVSDIVKITYQAGPPFVTRSTLFGFDGQDKRGKTLPVDKIIAFDDARWNLRSKLPARFANFGTSSLSSTSSFTLNYSRVPEPSGLLLFGFGLAGLVGWRLKTNSRNGAKKVRRE